MSWKNIISSQDLTHHLLEGQPLYSERFDEVLNFHAPGLAPVIKNGKSWHIKENGQEAYPAKFQRTFGFYEGIAAVIDENSAFHILLDGSPLYKERYSWTGNYQEHRCTVRTLNGLYHHIDSNGDRVGTTCWHYAGDYKDGIAVVQREDGYSSHVDRMGNLIHNCWFVDLDIYHKGYARAKESGGWVHIDSQGKPVYKQRYAMIEPFYNGQARVESFNGALIIINETGECLHMLRPERDLFHDLSRDLVGFWKTHTISTAVESGIIEKLPNELSAIATELDLPSDNCNRLLNALWDLNICCPEEDERWSLTQKGELLKKDNPRSLADAALEYTKNLEHRWFKLPEIIKGGHGSSEMDVFQEVCKTSETTRQHHTMLTSYARNDYPAIVPMLPFTDGQSIMDVGGSHGVLAKEIRTSFPKSKVTLLDMPAVVATCPIPEGVNVHPANFFEPWHISADIIIMSRILHDWSDHDASKILANARDAIHPGGKLLIAEMILEESVPNGHLCDLHLLAVTGGRERTLKQYRELFDANGFSLLSVHRGTGFISIIEALPHE